jgi:hypothetical protein
MAEGNQFFYYFFSFLTELGIKIASIFTDQVQISTKSLVDVPLSNKKQNKKAETSDSKFSII